MLSFVTEALLLLVQAIAGLGVGPGVEKAQERKGYFGETLQ